MQNDKSANKIRLWGGVACVFTAVVCFLLIGLSVRAEVVKTVETVGCTSWTVPVTGKYQIEVWGAQGGGGFCDNGDWDDNGGLGGYSSAVFTLFANQTLYISVGGKGETPYSHTDVSGGWNGGAMGYAEDTDDEDYDNEEAGGGGGGATHVATSKQGFGSSAGELKNYASRKDDVLIVAGGGGGGICPSHDGNRGLGISGGSGGGTFSETFNFNQGHRGTTYQEPPASNINSWGYNFKFGEGTNGCYLGDSDGSGGGGGGWQGGSCSWEEFYTSGTGGTGYIKSTGSSGTMQAGKKTGNGKCVITRLASTITVRNGTGVSSVSGGGTFNSGSVRTISCVVDPDYEFVNWTVTGTSTQVSTNQSYTFTLNSDVDYTANAKLKTVTYDVKYMLAELDGTYTEHETISRSATVASSINVNDLKKSYSGYTYARWGNDAGGISSDSFNVTRDLRTVYLYYDRSIYSVVLTKNDAIEYVTGSGDYKYGQEVTVKAQAKFGYDFENWTDSSGTVVSTDAEYTFNMPANSVSLAANGHKKDYRVYFDFNIPKNSEDKQATYIDLDDEDLIYDADVGLEYKTVKYGEKLGKLPEPSALGWIFNGWYLDADEDRRVTADTVFDESEDYILRVDWDEPNYPEVIYYWVSATDISNYVAPKTGNYEIEIVGAQGGLALNSCSAANRALFMGAEGGYGSRVVMNVHLDEGTVLYLHVGKTGKYEQDNGAKADGSAGEASWIGVLPSSYTENAILSYLDAYWKRTPLSSGFDGDSKEKLNNRLTNYCKNPTTKNSSGNMATILAVAGGGYGGHAYCSNSSDSIKRGTDGTATLYYSNWSDTRVTVNSALSGTGRYENAYGLAGNGLSQLANPLDEASRSDGGHNNTLSTDYVAQVLTRTSAYGYIRIKPL